MHALFESTTQSQTGQTLRSLLRLSLFLNFALCACGARDGVASKASSDSLTKPDQARIDRVALVDVLKQFERSVTDKDSVKMSACISFPISDPGVEFFTTNEIFEKELTTNGNKITKELFLRYFEDMRSLFWMSELNAMFQKVDLDSLLVKDTLTYSSYSITEPCYTLCTVVFSEREILFRMDSYSNEKYVGKNESIDEVPENSSEYCEHNIWWRFNFNGIRLQVLNIGGAG